MKLSERKCALTGLELSFGESNRDIKNRTASLDRINSAKGYIEGNLQWIHKKLQKIKGNLLDKDLVFWCQKIANYNLDKKTGFPLWRLQ